MKKDTLLTVAVLALLLLNFGTLGVLLLRRSNHPPGGREPGRLDRHIVETLDLNAEQRQKFEQLKSAHHEQMLASERAYRDALGNYFALLKADVVAPAQRDSLQAVLAHIQEERASVTFQHFSDLKALCSPEQQKHFAELLPDLMRVILPNNAPPRRKHE